MRQPTWLALRFLRGGGTGGGFPGSPFGGSGGFTCLPFSSGAGCCGGCRRRRAWPRRFGCLWFASSQLSQNTSLQLSQRTDTRSPPHRLHLPRGGFAVVDVAWPFVIPATRQKGSRLSIARYFHLERSVWPLD